MAHDQPHRSPPVTTVLGSTPVRLQPEFPMIDPTDINAVRLDRALDRKWAGLATAEDEALISHWERVDPALIASLSMLPSVARGEGTVSAADTRRAWSDVAKRIENDAVRPIHAAAPSGQAQPVARRDWFMSPRWGVVALAAAVLVTLTLRSARAPQELIAPRGQRISTTLPDGSTMTLGAGSRARWRGQLRGDAREVELDGEAFFTVAHDARRPFRVRARYGLIEDIGTRFSVRAWPELSHIEVTVEEGIVALRDTNSARPASAGVELRAGQTGRLSSDGQIAVDSAAPGDLGWVSGTLQFNDTPLREAVLQLERWYDVSIRLDSALATRRLTARFEAQPLEQLLTPLGLALDARVIRNGATITLVPR